MTRGPVQLKPVKCAAKAFAARSDTIGNGFLLKIEYSFQQGEQLDGTPRNKEDLFALTAAFAF